MRKYVIACYDYDTSFVGGSWMFYWLGIIRLLSILIRGRRHNLSYRQMIQNPKGETYSCKHGSKHESRRKYCPDHEMTLHHTHGQAGRQHFGPLKIDEPFPYICRVSRIFATRLRKNKHQTRSKYFKAKSVHEQRRAGDDKLKCARSNKCGWKLQSIEGAVVIACKEGMAYR